jgi:hypothetical protein
MNISQQTIALLKQFAIIKPGIVISPGNSINTRSDDIVAEATVPETFPVEVRLPDIHEFVRLLSLFKEPVCEFDEEHVRIVESDGTAETLYALGKPGSVFHRPVRQKNPFPSEQVTLTIEPEQWETLRRALGVNISKQNYYGAGQFMIASDGQKVQLIAQRGSHTQKIQYSLSVPAVTNGFECTLVLCADNLPSLPGAYHVTVYPTFVRFQQTGDCSLSYCVGSEPQSTWGGAQVYQVNVTKTLTQECCVSVNAHSPQEAEALAQKVQAFDWTGEPRQRIEYTTCLPI